MVDINTSTSKTAAIVFLLCGKEYLVVVSGHMIFIVAVVVGIFEKQLEIKKVTVLRSR